MSSCEGGRAPLCSFTDRKWTFSPSPHSSNRCLTGKIFSQLESPEKKSWTIHCSGGGQAQEKWPPDIFFVRGENPVWGWTTEDPSPSSVYQGPEWFSGFMSSSKTAMFPWVINRQMSVWCSKAAPGLNQLQAVTWAGSGGLKETEEKTSLHREVKNMKSWSWGQQAKHFHFSSHVAKVKSVLYRQVEEALCEPPPCLPGDQLCEKTRISKQTLVSAVSSANVNSKKSNKPGLNKERSLLSFTNHELFQWTIQSCSLYCSITPKLTLAFRVFLYSIHCEFGGEEQMLFEKITFVMGKIQWAGHKLPAPTSQQWEWGRGFLHVKGPAHNLEVHFKLLVCCKNYILDNDVFFYSG